MVSKRKIIRRAPHRQVGGFTIPHLSEQHLEWESMLERDALTVLSYCTDIVSLATQPISFKYINRHGKQRTSHPDIEAGTEDQKKFIIEVKPWDLLIKDREPSRFADIKDVLDSAGYKYVLMTDDIIRQEPHFSIAYYLNRYLCIPVETQLYGKIFTALPKSKWITLTEAAKLSDITPDKILHFAAHKKLQFKFSDGPMNGTPMLCLDSTAREDPTYATYINQAWSNTVVEGLAMGNRHIDQFRLHPPQKIRQFRTDRDPGCGIV